MAFELNKSLFGEQPKIVKNQRRINKKLQRTQASGNSQGITLGTPFATGEISKGVVRLPNRRVPLNPNQKPKNRVPKRGLA